MHVDLAQNMNYPSWCLIATTTIAKGWAVERRNFASATLPKLKIMYRVLADEGAGHFG